MPTKTAEHENLTLSPRDWESFLAALDDAERPRPRLKAAARHYQRRCEGGLRPNGPPSLSPGQRAGRKGGEHSAPEQGA